MPSPMMEKQGSISEQERVREEEHARALAARYGLPYVDLNMVSFDPKLLRTIPVELMYKYNFIPLKKVGGAIHVAIADPSELPQIDELELLLGGNIQVYVGTNWAIQETLKKSESSQRVLDEATEGFRLQVIPEEENGEETLSIDRLTTDGASMIKLVDSIIFTAVQRRASDIHVETRDREVIVKYRIDGVLYQAMEPIDKKFQAAIISRVKVMSELDIAERRVPQDGRFRLRLKGKTIDFRVSIMPSVFGEDAVIRILDKESINESFAELRLDLLGFSGKILKQLRKYIAEPYGMVLVTGPTGSGKTTTLYAALSEIKSPEDKIVTIEDPVEYQIVGITQVPVNEKKGLTFARGLRSILRHDPDKIMVGEIRDPETAQIAIQSALTGHLVFTTVHANNVIDVLGRFLHMGVEPYNFVSALICIIAQRLVRLLCPLCKMPVRADTELLVESGLDTATYRDFTFYQARGCPDCQGTGFKGRSAISELLPLSDRIRQLILDRKSVAEIKQAAREEGMTFLRESAVQKVLDGLTTLREINKVTFVE
ncbi:MAG: GspE/PulE family protein [Acidobacteriota bacterium]